MRAGLLLLSVLAACGPLLIGCGGSAYEPMAPQGARPLPDSSATLCVFNDQLPDYMSAAQTAFAASHYVGCQKVTRALARRLRVTNPNFLVLHYRLAIGLGHRWNGEWIQIINGDDWVREWPAPGVLHEGWFFPWSGQRVLLKPWGWYLMDVDQTGYREWWISQVLDQLRNNEDDGLFADACSVPNYLGAWDFDPPLPDYDRAFENDWTRRINSWLRFLKGRFGARYLLIPNAGYLTVGRDRVNYALADGVMVEGFAAPYAGDYYPPADWRLQMNRILDLARQDKVLLLQTYLDPPDDVRARLFYTACYLLVKGRHTYLNLDLGPDPEWFPEYTLDLGVPLQPLPAMIQDLCTPSGVYVRAYQRGLVLVNPGLGIRTFALPPGSWRKVTPIGGGFVPADANVSAWRLATSPAPSSLTLRPHTGVLLLTSG